MAIKRFLEYATNELKVSVIPTMIIDSISQSIRNARLTFEEI